MNTFKLKINQKIKLIDHLHMIERTEVNFSNDIGIVKSKDNKNLTLQLKKYYDFLKEWNNCIVFDIDDENHVDINCEFINEINNSQ